MAMHIDKEFISPKISTPVLYEWLEEIKEREGISFNHAVLQCIKNCMDEERQTVAGPAGNGD